jgi:hypothetical protein
MLTGERATEALEAMKERVKFVMCALDSYRKITTWSTYLKAFRATGFTISVWSWFSGGLTCASAMTIRRS